MSVCAARTRSCQLTTSCDSATLHSQTLTQHEPKGPGMFRRIMTTSAVIVGLHSTAGAAEMHTITMAGMTYTPATITVRVGDNIRFINDDTVDHVVFVPTVGHAIDLGGQKPDEARDMKL